VMSFFTKPKRNSEWYRPGVVAYACSPTTWKAEAGGQRATEWEPVLNLNKQRKKLNKLITSHVLSSVFYKNW
jgi:alanine racemase